ncbi:hypothetical protein BO71DRAFT_179658 [Aspergillus ellipticus CBS 707.79]|uniref:Uncharacterized protein n=1 Tax=Aspergillus ellipticus CBS 707.79 TaxID=1448320 RepID=A0A319CS69_9EURO|nr:hypothetical protein BO71DRAFT_179658 [Aspergillus ellipticus CBS 707.79]
MLLLSSLPSVAGRVCRLLAGELLHPAGGGMKMTNRSHGRNLMLVMSKMTQKVGLDYRTEQFPRRPGLAATARLTCLLRRRHSSIREQHGPDHYGRGRPLGGRQGVPSLMTGRSRGARIYGSGSGYSVKDLVSYRGGARHWSRRPSEVSAYRPRQAKDSEAQGIPRAQSGQPR